MNEFETLKTTAIEERTEQKKNSYNELWNREQPRRVEIEVIESKQNVQRKKEREKWAKKNRKMSNVSLTSKLCLSGKYTKIIKHFMA